MELLALATLFSLMTANAVIPGAITVAIFARTTQTGTIAGLRLASGVLFADLFSIGAAWTLLCYGVTLSDDI